MKTFDHLSQEEISDLFEETVNHTYFRMRRSIGYIGLALPILLIAGSWIFGHQILPSISEFYYTSLRNVFVGAIVSLALFLFCYSGGPLLRDSVWFSKDNQLNKKLFLNEDLLTTIAGVCALGIAVFPTEIVNISMENMHEWTFYDFHSPGVQCPKHINIIHLFCAGSFFLIMAHLIRFVFVAQETADMEDHERRIRIYIWSARTMMAALILSVLVVLFRDSKTTVPIIFILESIALVAMSTAWLTKGRFREYMANRRARYSNNISA